MKTRTAVHALQTNTPNPEPLVLESSAGVTLRCGETTLRLLPNGELQLNGQTIKIEANQTLSLNAGQVRVNCEE